MEILDIYGTNSITQILENFESEVGKCKNKEEIRKVCNDYYFFIFFKREANTINQYFSKFRKVVDISNCKNKEFAKSLLQMGKRASLAIRETKDYKGMTNYLKGDKESLKASYYLQKMKFLYEMIENDSFEESKQMSSEKIKAYLCSIFLLFATGRRTGEILKTLTLEKISSEKLEVSGLLKKRSSEKDTLEIPYFVDYEKIEFAFSFVRNVFKNENISLEKVNNMYSSNLKVFLKRYLDLDLKPHDLRAIYCELCYSNFKVKEDRSFYFSKILGHDFNLRASENYIKYS